jgi:hypothetical protein
VMNGLVERVYRQVSSFFHTLLYVLSSYGSVIVISVTFYMIQFLCVTCCLSFYCDNHLCYIIIIFINIIITIVIIVSIIINIVITNFNFNITFFIASPAMFSFQGPKIVMGRGIAVSGTFVLL